ncbi:metallophosphoesterase, partial [Xanthomonas citri pv. citri]|nr:metallophosphoesterase [Xanthomonas citri pv. citri]
MGWELLTNSSEIIYSPEGNDSIVIVGVENWGDPPFKQLGDIDTAYPTSGDSTVKILLTHNPRHWTDIVAPTDSMRYALTLSGHTHAM